MNQSFNYYPRQSPIQQQVPMRLLNGRPVTSLEEVRALPIDFDGSVYFFPDLANRRLYTKQINLDGTATINMYELKEMSAVDNVNYITREEFEAVITQLQASLAPPKQEIKTF